MFETWLRFSYFKILRLECLCLLLVIPETVVKLELDLDSLFPVEQLSPPKRRVNLAVWLKVSVCLGIELATVEMLVAYDKVQVEAKGIGSIETP